MSEQPKPPKRPAGTFIVTEMLTPEEIERLRRKAKENSARYRQRFGDFKIVRAKESKKR
jgi:hypothetical protein